MTHAELPDSQDDRIARLVAGEMTAAERAELEREGTSDPGLGAAIDGAAMAWSIAGTPDAVDVGTAWARLAHRIAADRSSITEIPLKRRYWPSTVTLMRAAAAAFVIVSGVAVYRIGGAERAGSTTATLAESTSVAQQTAIDLPDGSKVVLSASSSLRTLPGYGEAAREVELTGEAKFVVTHDEKRPFRVRTTGALIEDLGTEFVVRALPRQPVRVSVSEGSVSVRRTGARERDAIVLQPSDVALLPDTGDLVVTRGVDVETYQAWTRGQLSFRNAPLTEAIADLERWYDVDFNVTDPTLLSRTVNVTFDRLTTDDMLDVLGTILEVRFERRGRAISVAAPVKTGRIGVSGAQVGSGV